MVEADLERFHHGFERHYDQALAEIEAGRKRTHWMWFIFPQIVGLGTSPTAVHYAIRDRSEAAAFLADHVLGPGYRTLVDAVWRQVVGQGVTIRELFGRPDDQKLVSSLTLFAEVGRGSDEQWTTTAVKADEILDCGDAQGLPRCTVTQRRLAVEAGP